MLEQQIETKLHRISSLRSLAQTMRSFTGNEPVSHTRSVTALEDTVIKIMEQEEELNAEIDRLVDLKKEEIALYFPEMLKASRDCRFTPCTHTHEPGCAVKAAVDEGRISAERYNSYLGMLEEDTKFR